jgi:hypothetical protein
MASRARLLGRASETLARGIVGLADAGTLQNGGAEDGITFDRAGARGVDVPALVRCYIKTSFLFLLIGLLLGGYITLGEFFLGVYPPRLFVTAHVHLLLVGFMLMLVMGVATWMFPRPARDDTRYRPELAQAVYWVITVATTLRALAEVAAGLTGAPILHPLIALAGLGQLAGAALFVLNMWARVRMPVIPPPPR